MIPACKRRSLPELDERCGGNGQCLLPLVWCHCHNIGAPSAGPTQNSTRMPIPSLSHDALPLSIINTHCFTQLRDRSWHDHGPLRHVKVSFPNLNPAYLTNQRVRQQTKQNICSPDPHRLCLKDPGAVPGPGTCQLMTDEEGLYCTTQERRPSIEPQQCQQHHQHQWARGAISPPSAGEHQRGRLCADQLPAQHSVAANLSPLFRVLARHL